MWTCPQCEAKLVSRGLSHSCVRRTVEEFFTEVSARRPIDAELRRCIKLAYAIGQRQHLRASKSAP